MYEASLKDATGYIVDVRKSQRPPDQTVYGLKLGQHSPKQNEKTSKTLGGRSTALRVQCLFFFNFLSIFDFSFFSFFCYRFFFHFLRRFFTLEQVEGDVRDGRSRHQSSRFCRVNLATLKFETVAE